MKHNAEELIKNSLMDEQSFSSNSHVLEKFVEEGNPFVLEYEIPSRYNKDTLRMLFVNTEKYFVYWEISDETLEKKGVDLSKEKLHFKVYDNNNKEIYSFESSFALGDYYIKSKFENMDIYVSVGIFEEDSFEKLQTSNTIHTFSSQVNLPEQTNQELERLKYFTNEEIQRFSSLSIHEGNK